MGHFHLPRPRSLAGQLFAMQVVLVALVVAGCALFVYVSERGHAEEAASRQALAAAVAVADAPGLPAAMRSAEPTRTLQPYADRVLADSDITFVTIMDRHRTRYTHPNPLMIGKHFIGHTARALRGETFSETYTGTLGRSVRVVTPVVDENGRIAGLVSAGITIEKISAEVRRQVVPVLWVALAALAAGGAGTYLVNARLRRSTHGMNGTELSRMHDYHQAALHGVREGLLLLDGQRRIALINDAGRELLALDGDTVGLPVTRLGLPESLTAALLAAEPRVDELHVTEDRIVVLNTSPVSGGERHGTVVTLRDHTELQALSGELDSVRGFAEALRSQAHEAANRLHAVVSLIELGRTDEAVEFATAELQLAQALTDRVVGAVGEPVLAALLLGKAAQANESGVELDLTPDSRIDDGVLPPELPARDLVTMLGNLIDNAVDAAAEARGPGSRPQVTVTARATGDTLLLSVADTGPGVTDTGAIFERGWSTKPGSEGRGLGLALVHQAVRRHGGVIAVGEGAGGGAEFTVRLPLAGGTSGVDRADAPSRAAGADASSLGGWAAQRAGRAGKEATEPAHPPQPANSEPHPEPPHPEPDPAPTAQEASV